MELFFAPITCSMACRISLYEAGLDNETEFRQVGFGDKKVDGKSDYLAINPKGCVPALVTRDGTTLTENVAVLQYIADQQPQSALAPAPGSAERYQLQQWLNYIAMELHRSVRPIVMPNTPTEIKKYFLNQILPGNLNYVDQRLAAREFVFGETFSIADAYLVTMLVALPTYAPNSIDYSRYPNINRYLQQQKNRPTVARAIDEEMELLQNFFKSINWSPS